MIVNLKVHSGGLETRRLVPGVNVVRAAAAHTNLLTVEQFDIIVRCLHDEHIVRVYRVMEHYHAPAPEGHVGIPRDLANAIDEMRALEALMADMSVPKLPPDEIHSRVALLAEQEVRA